MLETKQIPLSTSAMKPRGWLFLVPPASVRAELRQVTGYFKAAPPLYPRLRARTVPTEGIFTFNGGDGSSVLDAWDRLLRFLHHGHGFWRISAYNAPAQVHGPWDGVPIIGFTGARS